MVSKTILVIFAALCCSQAFVSAVPEDDTEVANVGAPWAAIIKALIKVLRPAWAKLATKITAAWAKLAPKVIAAWTKLEAIARSTWDKVERGAKYASVAGICIVKEHNDEASSIADFVSDSAEGYKDITTKAMADWDWCAADTDNDGRFPPQSRIDSCRQGVRDNTIDAYLAQTGAIIKRAPDLWPMMEKIVQDCLKSSSIGYF